MGMKSQRSVPRPSSIRKERAIVLAAQECFAEHGYDATTLDEVAARAEVSKQMVYSRFANKEALFVHVIGEVTTQAFESLAVEVVDTVADAGLDGWLLGVGQRLAAAVLDPGVVRLRRLVVAEATRFPQLARMFWEHGAERTTAALADRVVELQRRGLLRAGDARVAASSFNWLVLGDPLTRAMMLGPGGAPANIDNHVREAVRVFLAAWEQPQ